MACFIQCDIVLVHHVSGQLNVCTWLSDLSWYIFLFFTGSELNLSNVFLLQGKDLFLELKMQKPTSQLVWRFKTKKNIIKDNPKQTTFENFYGKRVEYSTKNYSLQIKNVGLNDSGLYHAVDSGAEETIIAGYNVTVQGMLTETEYGHSIQAVSLFVY